MKYFQGLYFGSLYNLGFMGGWRCGNITVDGHYSFVTDLKQFVVWKFGTYANLISIIDDFQTPKLSSVEALFVNDAILEQFRRNMSNDVHPDLTDVSASMWDDVYGDKRTEAVKMWNKLEKHTFSKANVSPNITFGDTVKDTETGEEFKVNYDHDIKYINKTDKFVLTKRYDYFPNIPLHEGLKAKFKDFGLSDLIKEAYWEHVERVNFEWRFCVVVKDKNKFTEKAQELGLIEAIKAIPKLALRF